MSDILFSLKKVMNLKRPFLRVFLDILLALHGSIVISFVVPWSEVFSTSLPSGGDNPAHPVLMKSIGNAFFEHFSVVHYSWDFWSGFEAFQFYFPLPYLSGAILGRIIGDNIAFKLTTLFGLLAFPPALYIMTRLLGMTRVAGACASILAVSFLFTDAHVMWGGNVSSTLAGMIGNSWSFVFLVVAIGGLYRARIENEFSLFTLLCCIAAALCHFYAFLMLLIMSAIFMAEDLVAVFRKKFQLSNSYVFYLTLICFGLCLAWWFMPLFAYRRWSTDFGGTWDVKLLETLLLNEKWIFASAFLISIGACLYFRKGSAHIMRFFAFFIIFFCLFFIGEKFNSTITVNIRLWPSIYLSLFLITIATFDFISKRIPLPLSILLLAFTLLLIPSQSAFDKAHSWMQWNYSGVEAKPGAGDFWRIVKILSTEPKSKVSFESSPPNNTFIGSIRSLEVLPAFTGQTLVEGGIVNSATFPGIGYSLQCLMSHSCAGWPNGSSMPHHDVER
ncbi:MAG: hypothetical protein GYA55_11445, partial [SAR324 cluster bacterium]|nr:hypothetical protein [SAR324 cluster bacterium]